MRSTDICWMTQCKMRSQKRVLVEGWKKAACPDTDSCHSSSSEELRAIFAPTGSESPGGILMGWGRPLRRPEGRARLFLPHSNLPRPSLDLNTSGAPITSGPYSHAGPWDHSPPPGPLLHSQGVGTVITACGAGRCHSGPAPGRAPPPGALRGPAPLPRCGHPIHPAAVPANHRAPTAPHLAMGRGRAGHTLIPSWPRARARPGSVPGSDLPRPRADPACTWVRVGRRRARGRRAVRAGRRSPGI